MVTPFILYHLVLLRIRWHILMFILAFLLQICFSLYPPISYESSQDEWKNSFPRCGDCYCIPGPSGKCPSPPNTPTPPNAFPLDKELIRRLRQQKPNIPYKLSCNPYKDDKCQTKPPQRMTNLGETAVCGILYDTFNNCSTYNMTTYNSQKSAMSGGAVITHLGGT